MKPAELAYVSSEISKIVERFDVSLKNFRISEVAIEFDLFVKDADMKNQAEKALVTNFAPLLSERNLGEQTIARGKTATVESAIELLNQQRYWECHEVLEEIWRKEKDPSEKSLQQGVILVASALVHAQKNEDMVCLGMLSRSVKKLDAWEKQDYYGLNVGSLKQYIADTLESGRISFPKMAASR